MAKTRPSLVLRAIGTTVVKKDRRRRATASRDVTVQKPNPAAANESFET